ncbi:MAG TPA: carboxypeptidase-like regulatory domain-containing protein [Kofleriaceae bacterium]|jgi:hypothetical protein
MARLAVVAVLAAACGGGKHDKRAATGSAAPPPQPGLVGAITDDAKRPVANAQVCFERDGEDPHCANTDAQGAYRFALADGAYRVYASAASLRPAMAGPLRVTHETRVDLALHAGGATLAGTITDEKHEPIARALIRATDAQTHVTAVAITNDKGAYTAWLAPGTDQLWITARGYGRAQPVVTAPATFDGSLVREAKIIGTITDGARPVVGARLTVRHTDSMGGAFAAGQTDVQGRFSIEGLRPGRYAIVARAEHAYAQTNDELVVELGQVVDAGKLRAYPARRVTVHVTPCAHPTVRLAAADGVPPAAFVEEPDATLVADGVVPGLYQVSDFACEGYAAKVPPSDLVVGDRDLEMTWEMVAAAPGALPSEPAPPPAPPAAAPGATAKLGTIVGTLATDSGAQPDYVEVDVRGTGPTMAQPPHHLRLFHATGFTLRDVPEGRYDVQVVNQSAAASVGLGAGDTAKAELVMRDLATVTGRAVDAAGKPAAGVRVVATNPDGDVSLSPPTRADGRFTLTRMQRTTVQLKGASGATVDLTGKTGAVIDIGDVHLAP